MQVAVDVGSEPRWRWARLVEHLEDEAREALAERLKLPKAPRRLADQAALTRTLCAAARSGGLDGGRVMTWLDGIDAWRRAERVAPLIALVSMDDPGLAADLALAWRLAAQILPRGLVEEGYKGRALGEELARRRRAVIDEVLAES